MRELSTQELRQVAGGKITDVSTQQNGGGNTPNGNANGVPVVTYSENPAGQRPPGQQ